MTWGISGDRFLVIYLVVLATSALAGLLWRWWATAGHGTDMADGTDRIELAFLNAGGILACQVGLTPLRRTGQVEPADMSTLVGTGRLRPAADSLTRALHHTMFPCLSLCRR